jgi:hypothetical protein
MVDFCPTCRRSFDSPTAVLTHMAKQHSNGNADDSRREHSGSGSAGLECAECGERFSVEVELVLHAARPHSGLRRL